MGRIFINKFPIVRLLKPGETFPVCYNVQRLARIYILEPEGHVIFPAGGEFEIAITQKVFTHTFAKGKRLLKDTCGRIVMQSSTQAAQISLWPRHVFLDTAVLGHRLIAEYNAKSVKATVHNI